MQKTKKKDSRNNKDSYAIQYTIASKSFSTGDHPEKGKTGKSKPKNKSNFKSLFCRLIINRNKQWNVAYPAN
jgi:hypothetical protein